MVSRGAALLPLGVGTLALGMAIYHWVEGLGWPDAFLNAAMLLGGMGPVDPVRTTAGKWLAGGYALFAGVVFLVVAWGDVSPGHSPRPAAVPSRDGRGTEREALTPVPRQGRELLSHRSKRPPI
jgi:hypothetical protein